MTYQKYTQRSPGADGHPRDPEELTHDVQEIRGEISHTLDEIAGRLHPVELIKRIMSGGGDPVRNLGRTVAENPVPLTLIAAGFGYLMYSDAQRRKSTGGDGSAEAERRAGEHAGETARRAFEGAKGKAHELKDKAGQFAERAGDKASELSGQSRRGAQHAQQLLHEQPMVLAGLGIALGGVLAGMMPMSRKEAEAMGEPAREAFDRAKDKAHATAERTKEAAQSAARTATQQESRSDTGAGRDT